MTTTRLFSPGYMPGFRDACEWLNLCYKEGLLDPEAITQDSNVWGTKMNAGRVGYTTYLRLINTALTPDTAATTFQYFLLQANMVRDCKNS